MSTKHAECDDDCEDDMLQAFGFHDHVAARPETGGNSNRSSQINGQIPTDASGHSRNDKSNNFYVQKRDEPSMAREYENRCHVADIRQLMHEFDSDKLAIEADWMEWLKKTSYQLLK